MPFKGFMKITANVFVLNMILLTCFSAFGYIFRSKIGFSNRYDQPVPRKEKPQEISEETLRRLKEKALAIRRYNNDGEYNSTTCFLMDMRVASGKKRFFVYDLKHDSIEIAGLVTHGSGSDNGSEGLTFSNSKNSNCTSLGKYKIGNAYTGKFGLAYKLHGLDITNNNAFDRYVVLHAHQCIPDENRSGYPICVSLGCPTVAPAFLSELKKYLGETRDPILLWIYY